MNAIRIGCAGWALRHDDAAEFPPPGSHLERYARRLDAVEINSSFYRPHRRTTYERWAASVPDTFRFSVKLPRDITHKARLSGIEARLDAFLGEVGGLGDRLGALLVQLPPRLEFDHEAARAFFAGLRQAYAGAVVCEPRNASWFAPAALALLRRFDVARAAADPAPLAAAKRPAAAPPAYYRLHGSPRTYYSSYAPAVLGETAALIRKDAACGREVWCIFDNTAAGAALANALELQAILEESAPG